MAIAPEVLALIPQGENSLDTKDYVLQKVTSLGINPQNFDIDLFTHLTQIPDRGVSVFVGTPLDLNKEEKIPAWLNPIIIWGENGQPPSVFYVTSFGKSLLEMRDEAKLAHQKGEGEHIAYDVIFNFATETDMMLGNTEDAGVQQLQEAIDQFDGKPQLFIRMGYSGNVFHPLAYTPDDIPPAEVLHERLERLAWVLRLPTIPSLEELQEQEEKHRFEPLLALNHDDEQYVVGKQREVQTDFGTIFVYPVQIHNGEDRYIELFSTVPLQDLASQLNSGNIKDADIRLRPDSRDELCMVHHDIGCGCRVQAQDFLTEGIQSGTPSILISYQTHDKHGQGTIPGMILQQLERGQKMPGTKAAKIVHGEDWDKRNFNTGVKIFHTLMENLLVDMPLVIGLDTSNIHKRAAARREMPAYALATLDSPASNVTGAAAEEQALRRAHGPYNEQHSDIDLQVVIKDLRSANQQIDNTSYEVLGTIAQSLGNARKKDDSYRTDKNKQLNTLGNSQQAREFALAIVHNGQRLLMSTNPEIQEQKQHLLEDLESITQRLGYRSAFELLRVVRRDLDYNWQELAASTRRLAA